MNKLEILLEQYPDIELLTADGFDDAIIGTTYNKPIGEYVVVYSRTKCISILMTRDGMTDEVAQEYFDFNVEGAYMGKNTPIFVDDEYFNE